MKLSLVGTGMGDSATMTLSGARALAEASAVLGAPRLLEGLEKQGGTVYLPLALPTEMAKAIEEHPEWERVCVALSGDVGFYSAAKRLTELVGHLEPELICGISSPQQLAARLGRPWQDFRLVSAHGRDSDVLAEVLNHPAVFFLTGGQLTPGEICTRLVQAGLGESAVTLGENLGAPDERILPSTAAALAGGSFASLSVLLVENRKTFTRAAVSPGIADGEFTRGKAPMTKREVRVSILSRLDIKPTDVLYDIGAGTGSVAVEMALLARRGKVYAIECEEEACGLIEVNREKFGTYNLTVIPGMAPAALEGLPIPDAAFVGGSKGNLHEILEWLLEKNPSVRMVVSAVTLETLHEAVSAMEALGVEGAEVVQVAVTHAAPVGRFHMLQAQNPIFIISGGGAGGN